MFQNSLFLTAAIAKVRQVQKANSREAIYCALPEHVNTIAHFPTRVALLRMNGGEHKRAEMNGRGRYNIVLQGVFLMPVLICGSIAYDTIMVFHGEFKTHILPDQIHILNVAFVVPDMRREFGGTAGNIAYNLRMLGGDPLIMATVGEDFGPYKDRLDKLGISRAHVREISGAYMPQAFITTDLDANQITAFHPGAMASSYLNRVGDAKGITLGIVAPDSRDAMLQHASQFHDLKIPFIFDPGQQLPMFNGAELRHFIELADYVAVNDYEARVLEERIGEQIGRAHV